MQLSVGDRDSTRLNCGLRVLVYMMYTQSNLSGSLRWILILHNPPQIPTVFIVGASWKLLLTSELDAHCIETTQLPTRHGSARG